MMNSNVKSLLIAALVGGAAYLGSEQLKQVQWMQEHPEAWYVTGGGLALLGYLLRKKNMAAAMALVAAGGVSIVQGYQNRSGAPSSPSSPSSPVPTPAPAPAPQLPQGTPNPGQGGPTSAAEAYTAWLEQYAGNLDKLLEQTPSQGGGLPSESGVVPDAGTGALLRRNRGAGAMLTAMTLGRRGQ